jgi:hypothetical protein
VAKNESPMATQVLTTPVSAGKHDFPIQNFPKIFASNSSVDIGRILIGYKECRGMSKYPADFYGLSGMFPRHRRNC